MQKTIYSEAFIRSRRFGRDALLRRQAAISPAGVRQSGSICIGETHWTFGDSESPTPLCADALLSRRVPEGSTKELESVELAVGSIDALFTPPHIRNHRNRHRQLGHYDLAHYHARSIQAFFSRNAKSPPAEILEPAEYGSLRLVLRKKLDQFPHPNVEDKREPRVHSTFRTSALHYASLRWLHNNDFASSTACAGVSPQRFRGLLAHSR
jgi:hypothetical protein